MKSKLLEVLRYTVLSERARARGHETSLRFELQPLDGWVFREDLVVTLRYYPSTLGGYFQSMDEDMVQIRQRDVDPRLWNFILEHVRRALPNGRGIRLRARKARVNILFTHASDLEFFLAKYGR